MLLFWVSCAAQLIPPAYPSQLVETVRAAHKGGGGGAGPEPGPGCRRILLAVDDSEASDKVWWVG